MAGGEFCTKSACGACRWLQKYGRVNAECFKLLKEMGGDFTSDLMPIQFPADLYLSINKATADDKISFLYEATKQIAELFDKNESNVTEAWDKTKLDNLLTVLDRQSTNLEACAAQTPTGMFGFRKRLSRHFRKLNKFLKKRNYSQRSWELIRKEVNHHLHRLLFLANKVPTDF
ncbi:interferon phi 1 [Clupea harengus]|uniref:Interferon phi 1 n=1 Tax=Clupea harengus TaxID=7950 RepID=A0A6P8FVZ7_CLUHA|nr:interferon phi 1 [Clupea harengus]